MAKKLSDGLSILIITLLFVPTIGRVAAGDNWSAWRGPTGMGQSDEKDLPLTWGGKDQENVLWKVALFPSNKVRRDQNQSSPIVWGERVFVTSSHWPEGVSEKEYPEHHLTCFAAKSGVKMWDTLIPPGPWKLTDLRGGYTAPTPATDGKHVYVLFGSSVLAAVDVMSGTIAWRKEITPFTFDVTIGGSPVLFQDTVIVTCALVNKKESKLVAYSCKTGDVAWQQPLAVDWTHSTPILAKVGDKTQLLVAGRNGPLGLDPTDGKLLWEFNAAKSIGDTVSPTVIGDMVYVDSGRGGPGVAVNATGAGDVSKDGLRWRIASIPEGFSSPVVVGDYLYRLHAPGILSCRKWADGSDVFKERLMGVDQALSPFTTPDGRIYCAGAGKSYVLKAGPTPEILAQNDLGDPSRASPAVAGGRIFLKGGRYLFCIGKK